MEADDAHSEVVESPIIPGDAIREDTGDDTSSRQKSAVSAEESPVFSCRVDSTEVLLSILQTILLDKDQIAICSVTSAGMKFTVERSKVLQVKAYLKSSIFREFRLLQNVDSVEFSLNLSILLQCLQIFGEASHMELSYLGAGHPVSLILEDQGVITQCQIRTLDAMGPIDFNFRSSPIVSRAIVKSELLKEALAELEPPGGSIVQIRMSPEASFLSMAVNGDSCSAQVDFPSDGQSNDVFTAFECKEAVTNSYKLNLIRPCVKVLAKSEQTNIRMNSVGMLSMQHVIPAEDGNTNWIEFLICSEELE